MKVQGEQILRQECSSNIKKGVIAKTFSFFAFCMACFLLTSCSSPTNTAQNLVFRGTTQTIGDLLRTHPQVSDISWEEMPVLGEGVVVAKVSFKAKAVEVEGWNATEVEKERMGYVAIKCVKNSGQLISVESSSYFKNGKEVVCIDQDYFLQTLENKENLAYGFWGMSPDKFMLLLQSGALGADFNF
jgi:hypothetical protein